MITGHEGIVRSMHSPFEGALIRRVPTINEEINDRSMTIVYLIRGVPTEINDSYMSTIAYLIRGVPTEINELLSVNFRQLQMRYPQTQAM